MAEQKENKQTPKPSTLLTTLQQMNLQTDWKINPLGWINELFQNSNALKELSLLSDYYVKTHISFVNSQYWYQHSMTYHQYNQSKTIMKSGLIRKNVEKEVALSFCKRMNELAGLTADAQMDSTESTEQGTDNVTGDKQVNTILTLGTSTQANAGVSPYSQITLASLSSSQEKAFFPVLLDRWLQIDHFTLGLTDTVGGIVKSWSLPDFFYNNTDSPNKLPFHQFVLMQPNIEIKFKVNSHKFAQGKYVISYIYDGDRFSTGAYTRISSVVQRPHVFMDLNESNEAEMRIAYRAKTPYIFTLSSQVGIDTGTYVKVFLHALSPLRVPDGSPTTVPVTMFIKFPNTHFTGMRFYKELTADAQMGLDISKNVMSGIRNIPIIGGLAGQASNMLGNFALAIQRPFRNDKEMKDVEDRFKYVGIINNRDKPNDIRLPVEFRPNVVGDLARGVGVENLHTMRLDPTATAVVLPEHMTTNSPKSVKDIIQIWGLKDRCEWTITDLTEKLLWAEQAWPTYHTNSNATVVAQGAPVEHMGKYYQYYTGSLEYRFDIIGTQFHTGTLMVSFIPYNEDYTYSQARSGYFKTFDLREQKSFSFSVPYIRHTVMQTLPYTAPILNNGIDLPSPGEICLWVVNPLTPIQTVSSSVEILIFKRAGPDFEYVYIRPNLASQGVLTPNYGTTPVTIIADAQMETGEKENVDTSPIFSEVATYSSRIQVNEDHMNIKDIMRRWVSVDAITINNQNVFLPVYPLNFEIGYRKCLQGWLVQNFRWSRGGICYMFQAPPGLQINITHIPQGVTAQLPAGSVSHQGYARQFWDTTINTTFKMEIPFNGIFNYQDNLVYETLPPVYDRAAMNLGIIQFAIINFTESIVINRWIRAADDYELIEYVGVGERSNVDPTVGSSEEADAQMDHRDILKCGDVESNPGPGSINDGGIMSSYTSFMPNLDFHTKVWGGVKRISSNVINPIKNASEAVANAPIAIKALETASNTWQKTGEKTGEIMEYLKDIALNITDTIKKSCSWVTSASTIFNAILHFLQMVINPTWQSFVISMTGIFTSIGNCFSSIAEKLFAFFMSINRTPTEHPAGDADAQMDEFDDEDRSNLCALLFGAISGYLGYKGTAPNFSVWTKLLNMSNNFWRTLSGATRFLSSIITLFKKMFYWVLKRIPVARNYFTLYSENESICSFVEEAQYCTNEVNIQSLQENPAFKYRFWCCVVAAYKLQQKLITKPEKNTQALLRLIQKVIDKSNELVVSMVASPVRYEPFVLKLEGETKIGKSFMAQEAIPKFLHDAFEVEGFGPPIFVRTPGVEFWNGFINQRAILYDDFLAVLDPAVAVPQVVEMYNLKSTAIMNVNMPDLESKKIRANPNLVVLLMNKGFTVLNGTVDPKAFLRRSDSMWKVTLKKEYEKMPFADIPDDVKKNFTHLQFQRYLDPSDPKSLEKKVYGYKAWHAECTKEMQEYHAREKINMTHRMQALSATLPEKVRTYMNNVDPFSIFYAIFNEAADKSKIQTGWLPSQQLTDMLKLQADIYDHIHTIQSVVEPQPERVATPPPIIHEEISPIVRNSAFNPDFASEINSEDSVRKRHYRTVNKRFNSTMEPEKFMETFSSIQSLDFTNVASAQFDIPDIRVLGISVYNFVSNLIFKPLTALNYEGNPPVAECPVCTEVKELMAGCANSEVHRVCLACYDNIMLSDNRVCPMCRCDNFTLLEQQTLLRRFTLFYYSRRAYLSLQNYTARIRNDPRQEWERLMDWLRQSPTAKIFLTSTLILTYASLLSHVKALEERNLHNNWHWLKEALGISHWAPEKANLLGGLIGNNHWVMHLCGGDLYPNAPRTIAVEPAEGYAAIGRYALHNDVGVSTSNEYYDWAFGQMENEESSPPLGLFNNYIDNLLDEPVYEEALDGDFRDPLPPTVANLNTVVQPTEVIITTRSPLILRELPVGDPVPIGETYCPHITLYDCCVDRTRTCSISFEYDFEKERYGWYSEELDINMPDAPCQYSDCPLKSNARRAFILHKWALYRENTVRSKLASWRPGAAWPLPEEFRNDQAVQLNNRVQQHLLNQVRQFADPIGPHWTERIGKIWNHVWKALKLAMTMMAALSTVIKTIQFARWMCGKGGTAEPNLIGSGSINTTKLPRSQKVPRSPTTRVVAHINESQVTSALNNVARNTFFLQAEYLEKGNERKVNMRGLGLFGRIGIIPAHYGKYIINAQKREENKEISGLRILLYPYQNKEIVLPITVSPSTFAFSDSEHCYFRTPPQFPLFKDLTHLIPTSEEHSNVGNSYWHVEPSSTVNTILQVEGSITGFMDTLTINGTQHFDSYKIFDVYATSYGRKGACGSVYMNSTTKPIFALHVAGNDSPYNTSGYGIPLIKEDIDALKEGKTVLSYFVPQSADANISLPGQIIPISTIDKKQKPKIPEKTKIIKSLISDLFDTPPITAPAILSARDARWVFDKSPLYWGCLKHTNPPLPFNKRILLSTFEELRDSLIPALKPLRSVEPLSYIDAIRGIKDVEYFDALDMTTSVGWPWNIGQKKRKDDWIKFDRDETGFMQNIVIDEKLIQVLDLKANQRNRGIKPFTVFLDWLKDERRKAKKLALADGTRIFSLSPIDFTIQLRQFTLDFSAAFMSQCLNINSIVGITADGVNWSKLANNLKMFSPHIITFDYSDFGPRLPADVGYFAFEMIKEWYKTYAPNNGDYYMYPLACMCEEIFNAYHLMNDFIYQTLCGAPSGTATTVIQNTLVNILMLRYIWRFIILTNSIDPVYLNMFDKYVKMYLYGDDGIMAVKEEVLEWFNLKNIMLAFDKHGIIITDAEKLASRKMGEEIPNLDKIPLSTSLENSTVLKRGFKPHPLRKDHWLAPLDEVSVHEAARWIWTSPDPKEATFINCEQSVMLAFGHGPKYFNNWKKTVNDKLAKINLPLVTRTWSDLDINFFGSPEIHGNYVPNTWDSGTFGLMVKDQSTRKSQKENEDFDLQSSRLNGQNGLKANVVVVKDRDLIKFNKIGGGILPSALNFELEFSSSLIDPTMSNTGGNATYSDPF